jgi:predicted negative regulator of RcsB-dependent stress response
MNNEFLWRNQMRKQAEAVEPEHDLWPAIAARLTATAASHRRSRRSQIGWLAIAATLVVAGGAGLTAYRWQRAAPMPARVAVTATDVPAVDAQPVAAQQVATQPVANSGAPAAELTALDWAVPDDPTLAASAQNLDNASAQLQDALEQRPDAVFLVGLLNRTNSMRLRLLRKSPNAG